MQHATPETVLGDFDDARFSFQGVESRFFRRDGRFFVRTDGPDGKLADFEVKYTFGVEPLQQYLVELPGGRLQALALSWDARPASAGGQRWFRQYPDEQIDHRDELHWTGRAQNWNFMCADCHSTDVRKGFDAGADAFDTRWSEISVGCEACHGPGSAHVAWSRAPDASDPSQGLTVVLDERRGAHWSIDPASGNAQRSAPRTSERELEVCAQCHSRRSQFAEGYRAGHAVAMTITCRPRSRQACTTPTASSATRCSAGVRSARAACTRPASPAATATSRTGRSCVPRATPCAPSVTPPRNTTPRRTTSTRGARRARSA